MVQGLEEREGQWGWRWVALIAIVSLAVTASIQYVFYNSTSSQRPCKLGAPAKPGELLCTFADEFDSDQLDPDKWLIRGASPSGIRSGTCHVDSPRNVSIKAGVLNLTVRKEASPFLCVGPGTRYRSHFSSGSVSTWKRFSQTYGRFEIRAKFPATSAPGLQSALWLYPQNLTYGPWPRSGEIDIAEYFSAHSDGPIPYVHYANSPGDRTVTNRHCKIADMSDFHTYAADWTPTSLTITYDEKVCLFHKWNPAAPLVGPQPFDRPFIVLLTQGLGINNNAFVPGSTPLPATTQIDYVHVWSRTSTKASARPGPLQPMTHAAVPCPVPFTLTDCGR